MCVQHQSTAGKRAKVNADRVFRWLDDVTFVELLSISQSLPGLNATNMAILVGQRLAGRPGATLAILGMCLPGAILMFAVGIIYVSKCSFD